MGKKKKSSKEAHPQHKQEEEEQAQLEIGSHHQKPTYQSIELKEGVPEDPLANPTHRKKKHRHQHHHNQNILNSSPIQQPESLNEKYRHFTWQEIGKHDSKDDAWVVIEDNVYDVTKLIASHPGGPKVIEQRAGKTATKRFQKGHHPYHVVEEKLPRLMIGRVHMDSCIESWQREKKTGKMDLFCVVVLSLTLFGSLIYLATA